MTRRTPHRTPHRTPRTPPPQATDSFDTFLALVKQYGTLGSVGELLSWDQEVMMPEGGAEHRARQLGVLASVQHGILTSDQMKEQLKALAAQEKKGTLGEEQRAFVREVRRLHDRATKVPATLVQEYAETSARAVEVWRKAREENNFKLFGPHLEKLFGLAKEYAQAIDPKAPPYEVLLQEYEPYASLDDVRNHLMRIKEGVQPLFEKLKEVKVEDDFLEKPVDQSIQEAMNKRFAEAIGFDFSNGRLDASTHPFTANGGDVRITTRYTEGWLSALFSTIHETGHALYEQGLPSAWFGTPFGEPRSLAIHESQSRLWENNVARNAPFWNHFYKELQEEYTPLKGIKQERFLKAINKVQPGLIRVNADEVTYPLHVILRFEIEQEILDGKLAVKDLPAAWNKKMHDLLGITPANDKEGVLQDTHWAAGLIGYFPTYVLGSMISAQLYNAALKEHPTLEKEFEEGNYRTLLDWLRRSIHTHGCRYLPSELVERATGSPPTPEAYLSYLNKKYERLFLETPPEKKEGE